MCRTYLRLQANLNKNPLEVYLYMYSEGVCDQVAKFYIELAWELEQRNNFKKAEQTFKVAGQKITNSEDKELVLTKHKQFQARVMKRMLETSSDAPAEEERTALSSLKSHGKHGKVGSLRVGSAKKSDNPGILASSGQLPKSSGNTFEKCNSKCLSNFQQNTHHSRKWSIYNLPRIV